jgi:hypothetical protein
MAGTDPIFEVSGRHDGESADKERILALAALFRPLPGQGLDDVNPPTVADLEEAQERLPRAR